MMWIPMSKSEDWWSLHCMADPTLNTLSPLTLKFEVDHSIKPTHAFLIINIEYIDDETYHGEYPFIACIKIEILFMMIVIIMLNLYNDTLRSIIHFSNMNHCGLLYVVVNWITKQKRGETIVT